MVQDHNSNNLGRGLASSFGLDYEVLWRRLEERLLELQKHAADACCIEKDNDNRSRWQGIWGAFGTAINTMVALRDDARGHKPADD